MQLTSASTNFDGVAPQAQRLYLWNLFNVSQGCRRPLLPGAWYYATFFATHFLAQTGVAALANLVAEPLMWFNVKPDIRQWTRVRPQG